MPDRLAGAPTPDGLTLAVSDTGDGPVIVLIPGLGATRRVFDPLVPALNRWYRTLVFDHRGVGESPMGSAPVTLPLLAGDVASVIDAAGLDSAFVLGASMGGAVAQRLVVSHPDRVRRLVLAATQPPFQHAVPASAQAMNTLLGKGARTPADAYRRACTVLYSVPFQRTHEAFIEEQIRVRAAHPVRARVFSAQLQALRATSDVWERLPAVATPTLVMHGTADVIAPFENAHILAARIPSARTRWFDACGHLFFHERPEESARVIHEFLRSG
ncbi:MAG: alpha/beta fold hydrolase [Candidatus Dormibacteria bacterium]